MSVQQGKDALAASAAFKYEHIDFNKKAPIPDSWIKVACCAFSFSNFDFNSCFGCKSNCQVCCCETKAYQCKIVEHERVKCIYSESVLELVNFVPALNCYRQCFCFEVALGLPNFEGYMEMPVSVKEEDANFAQASPNDIYPCAAQCCCINSIYPKYPDCIGCFDKSFMCCCESSSTGCKPMFLHEGREKKELLCLVSKGVSHVVSFKPECSGISQFFCRDGRSSFPCNDDVPCLFTACFITCCVNFGLHIGVAKTLGDLQGAAKDKPMPDAIGKNIAAAQGAANNATQN